MFGKKVPHWVLAIGDDGEHIVIHDPWIEGAHAETAARAAHIRDNPAGCHDASPVGADLRASRNVSRQRATLFSLTRTIRLS